MASKSGRLLLTGGLGYLGGRVATHLAAEAPELFLRLMTRRDREAAPEWARPMDVVTADILDKQSLNIALDGIDTVIHLAAVNEIDSQSDPDLALEVNGRATYRLLQACQAKGISKFIYFSTFHVYGPGAKQPITEETPTRPVHPYAITHHLAEDYVNWHRHSHGMDAVIIRLSNGYGYPADPGVQRWTLVFNDLCRQAVEKEEIRLRSGGTQQRDFIPLHDVVRGVRHFLNLPTSSWRDGLFNLGGDCSMSILEVAERVAREYQSCYGKEIPVITPGSDPQPGGQVTFSIDKLKQTGFSLQGDIGNEIRGTFKVCEQLVREQVRGR